MPPQQNKTPDFIPADPGFIPAAPDFIPAQQLPPPATTPTTLQKAMTGAKDLVKGVGEGALSTISGADDWMRAHGPAFLTNSNFGFGKPADLEHIKQMATPANATQAVGKGAEQAAEFLIPGAAEEAGAAKLAKFLPMGEKMAPMVAHALTSAIGSGAVNAVQGGSPITGAAMGVGGSVLDHALKAMAPGIAESALGIRKLDRAYGKTPGAAILNETKGFSPGTIAKSAQGRLDELNPLLNDAADRASVRPNPVRGLLNAPPEEIPLAAMTRAPKSRPMVFDAKVNPEEAMEPRSGDPMAPISDYPGINPHYLSGSAHPELSGRIPTMQGVLIRPQAIEAGQAPIAKTIANNSASLSGARGELSQAFSKAFRQGERSTASQLEPMARHLSETINGEPIPSNVTPRQLLDLKRGFGNEFIHRWNPDTMEGVKGTAARTYHQMGEEFNRTVPEARPLNQRISNLIPVAKRGESAELNAPMSQRLLNRVGAHTGALTGAIGGGALGYRQGGLPKALEYGGIGLIAPELIASPEGKMLMARTLNSPATGTLTKAMMGGMLQADRKKKE